MNKKVKVYNDEELVFEGLLDEFLEINSEDKAYILSHLDFTRTSFEFSEVSGNWKIVFI